MRGASLHDGRCGSGFGGPRYTRHVNLTIAAAQSASVPGDIERNVEHHRRIGEIAATHGAQLLVFPELSLIGYELELARAHPIPTDDARLEPLRELAARSGMTIVAGGPVPEGADRLFIGAFILEPDRTVRVYTKVHVHESEIGVFTPGFGGEVVQVGEAAVALAICRDASFAGHASDAADRGADVYAAGVMIDEPGYARKMPLLKGYAAEHRMAVLMANYSGVTGGELSAGKSAVWSETGEAVAASAGSDEELVIARKWNGAWSGEVAPLA